MLLIAMAALAAMQPETEPDLDWLAGYWLSCEDGVEASETWSTRRGGVMLGSSITNGNDAFGWEQTRIEAGEDGLTFHARPRTSRPRPFASSAAVQPKRCSKTRNMISRSA
jgi:hypothetical protein